VRIAIVDRGDNEVTWIKTESFHVYHFANGFEEGRNIVVDYVRHDKSSLGGDTKLNKSPSLYRATIDLDAKTVKHSQLDNHAVEFPRINEKLISQANRYIYLPTQTTGDEGKGFNALMKYDLEEQKSILHDFGKDVEIGEAVFVAKASANAEDDGYLALFTYDKNEDKSDFVLLDAQSFMDKPIASVRLPRRVPHGLHGSWMSGGVV